MTKIKLLSWNVNSLTKREKNGQLDWFYNENFDILCLQETKLTPHKRPPSSQDLNGYYQYHSFSEKSPGYAGVGIFTRFMPLNIENSFNGNYDGFGRIMKADYEGFTLLNVYFPHEGAPDCNHYQFYRDFLDYVKDLKQEVLICGDLNIAHHEKDLENPQKGEMGFKREQRDFIDELVSYGYRDTFRINNLESGQYSWWGNGFKSREGRRGWRIDYFFASEGLKVADAYIRDDIKGSLECAGSDHCPIGVEIEL